MSLTPYETVKAKYRLPANIEERDWQVATINTTAPMQRSGLYLEVGCGKTFISTINALYKNILEDRVTVVTMPPILIPGWLRWLAQINGITVVDYRGSPKERKALNLDADFIVMSMQIFKNDFDHILDTLEGQKITLINDEATCIKNIESGNYKHVKQLLSDTDTHLMNLTGTPLATPADAYAYVKLTAPLVYSNHRQFELLHVEKKDFWGKVSHWANLPLLKDNMKINTVRLLRNDVLKIPAPIIEAVPYDLYPEHYALYQALIDEQLDLIPNKNAVDAITEAKLRARAQQLIFNYAHFANQPGAKSAPYEILDEVISQMGTLERGGRKLIIFANFRSTMTTIKERYGGAHVGCINGDYNGKQKELFLQNFVTDPKWNLLLIHPDSGGKGLDGLQRVCSDAIFVECPTSPIAFEQCVGRIARDGQISTPLIKILIAAKTVQVSLHKKLLKNDEQAGYVQGSFKTLREALYGD